MRSFLDAPLEALQDHAPDSAAGALVEAAEQADDGQRLGGADHGAELRGAVGILEGSTASQGVLELLGSVDRRAGGGDHRQGRELHQAPANAANGKPHRAAEATGKRGAERPLPRRIGGHEFPRPRLERFARLIEPGGARVGGFRLVLGA